MIFYEEVDAAASPVPKKSERQRTENCATKNPIKCETRRFCAAAVGLFNYKGRLDQLSQDILRPTGQTARRAAAGHGIIMKFLKMELERKAEGVRKRGCFRLRRPGDLERF